MIAGTLLFFELIIGLMQVCAAAFDGGLKNKTIEELEKQKSELYKKINYAIDESVKSLIQANDSEAALGLEYMRDLKEHIKDLNGTEKESNEDKTRDVDPKSDLENRRSYKGLEYYKKKDHLKEPFDFEKALKPKRISGKEWLEMKDNRFKMQQKLDMWIKERQKERDRIKKYRMETQQMMLSGKYEKCPRYGYRGRKRKDRNNDKLRMRSCRMEYNATMGKEYERCIELTPELVTAANDHRRKRRRRYGMNKYPCCRKCCKQSYMGCL